MSRRVSHGGVLRALLSGLAAWALVLVCSAVSAAQEEETFEEWLRRQEQGVREQAEEFEQFRAEVSAQYRRFYEEQQKEFREYQRRIQELWGEEKAAVSTQRDWVSYGNNYSSRRMVDFEQGTASIEVLVEEGQAGDREFVEQRLREEIAGAVTARGGEDPMEARSGARPGRSPVLGGQVRMRSGREVTGSNAREFAAEIVAGSPVRREAVTGRDGKRRVAVAVSFQLVPEHIRVRAGAFKNIVQSRARRWALDPQLVFAVIHTESWFNPWARSKAPAFGLMQLVPTSGARAAYLHLHGRDTLLGPEYLYDPENNILLGSAYLDRLLRREFRDVRDALSRMYCAIAAYNTGPGNVARALAGKRDLESAVRRVNGMSPEEVFRELRQRLPFQETREYLTRVTDRMPLYAEWGAGAGGRGE
ncbi:MAG: murein transglycosylase domain-containing protein [Bacteroidota bacterium]